MADSSPFKLIIEDDEGRRSIIPVDLGTVDIGRLESNTIKLDERNVSRQHARLFRQDSAVFAEDLDSYNGVWINGDRIHGRQELREGDLLRIGDFHIELRGEGLQRRKEETTQRTNLPEVQAEAQATLSQANLEQNTVSSADAAEASSSEVTLSENTEENVEATALSDAASSSDETPRVIPASDSGPRAAVATLPPTKNGPPPPAPLAPEEDEPDIHEATAIIRMDDKELLALRAPTTPLVGQKAKLICVSTNFAGREFELNKGDIVIGRTSDNDITIDHRSVSRHHAKIIISNKRYLLHDLKSANGTLINGETYAQTELKRGDLIELGHVKLRFVPPGESYTLSADELAAIHGAETAKEESVSINETSRMRAPSRIISLPTSIIIGSSVLTLVLVAVITALVLKQRSEHEPVGNAAKNAATSENPVDQNKQIQTLLGRGHGFLAQRRWEQAASIGGQILGIDANSSAGRELITKAQNERQAQTIYEEAQKSVAAGDWRTTWKLLQNLPSTSVYAEQSRALSERVRNALISDLIIKARSALAAKEFDTASTHVQEIVAIDNSRGEIVQIRGEIERARIAQRRLNAADRTSSNRPSGRHSTSAMAYANRTSTKTTPVAANAKLNPKTTAKTNVKPPKTDNVNTSTQTTAATSTTTVDFTTQPATTTAPAKTKVNEKRAEAKIIYGNAVAMLKAGDIKGAIDALNRCISLDENYAACYRALGIAYARGGNGPKAAKYYKQYLKANPNAPDADKVRQLLEQYETAP
ncbi:MAG: FHA domain-containing protein [Deltaproteobacteria bacterium]|nr:FHA domain-containing protein [Deltaproteobacteria bacterium]